MTNILLLLMIMIMIMCNEIMDMKWLIILMNTIVCMCV